MDEIITKIKKVKVKEGKVCIKYDKIRGDKTDEYSLKCNDRAKPSFYDAIDRLRKHVLATCELPDSYLDRITVTGVSFSWAQGIMGAVLIAQMTLKKSVVALNLITPHKSEEAYSEGGYDPQTILDGDCVEDLQTLLNECVDYINGDREQGELFEKRAAAM